jgi:hypothetical protein
VSLRKVQFGAAAGGPAWDIALTGAAIRAAYEDPAAFGTTGSVTGWRIPGLAAARLSADSMTGPRLVRQQDGTYRWEAHNLLLNSATLSTQSITVVVGQVLTIAATGTGSVTLSNAATGTLNASSARPSLTVTATTTTLTCTVSGTVTEAQVNRGAVALAYVPTAGAARFAPPVEWDGDAWGVRSEPAATNQIRNSAMQGAASGSPGTLPPEWGDIGGPLGLSRTITTGVTLDGLPAIDIRYSGTPSAGLVRIRLEGQAQVVAAQGQVWSSSMIAALNAGSSAGVSAFQLGLAERTADGSLVTLYSQAFVPTAAATRPVMTHTVVSESAARVTPEVQAVCVGGTPVDFTLRIAQPQLELGPIATSPIPTFGAAVTRTIDAITAPGLAALTAGTLYAEYVPRAASSALVADLDDGTANEVIALLNDGVLSVVDGGVSQAAPDAGTPTVGAANKIAGAFAANDFAVALNGGAVQTDTSGTMPTTNRLVVGDGLNGSIRTLRLIRRRLPNAQLQAMTL